ncbi:alpha/beta fold hydrolase [Micromonospora yangpuensis]|uniref:Alpha/beta hydrolase family protein n=1 Tax=Micromonospora yangpuensis TaxID=683228 RepID=A0A1C6UV51_9ACTN|nr:alpha/beta hydrolase [Micromonospora yangpuensis]GGM23618.1 alpha/beta hydrolase [Micromonospora yangpuensis]SCL57922.1 Alpha/beta hydrolase family protein [Micromonospora yangpuensis]
MATFVLIHGGGGSAWDWHLVVPELSGRGHDVVVPELPIGDRSAGFTEFRQTVVDAVGDRRDLVVVGHSYGALTAPLVAERLPVRLIVLLTPMIPKPGERPGQWWDDTGHRGPEGLSEEQQFYQGVPAETVAAAAAHNREQVSAEWDEPWPLEAWPAVPTRVLIAREDRFFPVDFQRRVGADRLGIVPDDMDGCHAVALSHPKQLADRLIAYLSC